MIPEDYEKETGVKWQVSLTYSLLPLSYLATPTLLHRCIAVNTPNQA